MINKKVEKSLPEERTRERSFEKRLLCDCCLGKTKGKWDWTHEILHIKGNCERDKKTTYRLGCNSTGLRFPKDMNSSYNSMTGNQTTPPKNWQKPKTDTPPKKTQKQPLSTWEDAQCWQLLDKFKSKLQWCITSHWSERPSSKSLQVINAGDGVEKRELLLPRWWKCIWCGPSEERYGGPLKTSKQNYHRIQWSHSWVYI